MKYLVLFISLMFVTTLTISGQSVKKINWANEPDTETGESNDAATQLLYDEINYYRQRHGLTVLTVSTKTKNYAVRWGKYMMDKHVNQDNSFYEHSKLGPEELKIPYGIGEIIHNVYFDHKPSAFEAAGALMYGLNRGKSSIIGWIQSPGHELCIVQPEINYFGGSVYIAKRDKWWIVYSCVNFSIDQ